MAGQIIPPRRNDALTGNGVGTTRFMEYLERVAVTSNDLVYQVTLNTANIADLAERVSQNEIDVAVLQALVPVAYYVVADHTVTANETITCGNVTGITITLPIAPIDQQRVSVKRAGGIVSLDANGKLIDGQTSIIISRKYTGLTIEYSTDAGYWSII